MAPNIDPAMKVTIEGSSTLSDTHPITPAFASEANSFKQHADALQDALTVLQEELEFIRSYVANAAGRYQNN